MPMSSVNPEKQPALSLRWFILQSRRIVDRRFVVQFGGVTLTSLLISTLDAIGILLIIPLVAILSSGDQTTTVTIPLIGEVTALPLILAIVGFFIAKTFGAAAIRWWSTGVVQASSARTSAQLFRAYMSAPLSFHDRHNSSTTVRTTSSTVDTLYGRGFMALAILIAEGSTLIVLTALIVVTSPAVALAAFVYFLVASLLFLKVVQARVQRLSRSQQVLEAAAIQTVQEGLGGLKEHRVRGSEVHLTNTFREQRRQLAKRRRVIGFSGEVSRYYLEILFVGAFGVISVAVLTTRSSAEALSVLALALGVGFRILPSISRLLASVTSLRSGAAALEVLITDMNEIGLTHLKAASPAAGAPGERSQIASRLELQDLTFTYPGSNVPAVKSVNLELAPGSSLGIVGPSGAGKSTLIDLICGLRNPQSGQIVIDGKPIASVLSQWRSAIGLVTQDVYLLDASVAQNVAFGLPVDEASVHKALERAQLWSFVETLDEGMNSIIGERGTRLSGGQKQRIGIARALYSEPSILVLDEATAALDMETEAAVVESVESLAGEVSVIVVAHRLSTIRRCDSVAYLDSGLVRARGTFTEVACAVPEFRRALDLAGINAHTGANHVE
jgi:ATP-binding cassette, subfamily B, bacterial PglK